MLLWLCWGHCSGAHEWNLQSCETSSTFECREVAAFSRILSVSPFHCCNCCCSRVRKRRQAFSLPAILVGGLSGSAIEACDQSPGRFACQVSIVSRQFTTSQDR